MELISFHTPAGQDNMIDVSMASMHSDHSIVARLNLTEIKSPYIYFQFVLIHSDFYGQRKLRVINFALGVTTSVAHFLQSINCEALCFYTLRSAVDRIRTTEREQIRTDLISSFAAIVKEYRRNVSRADPVGPPELPAALEPQQSARLPALHAAAAGKPL